MKKMLLMVAVALLGTATVNAQYKPEGLSFATELNYAPAVYNFSASSVSIDDGGFVLPEYGAKVRLFLNETVVARLSLGLGMNSEKDITYTTILDPIGTENRVVESYDKTTNTIFSLFPGIEYHFNKYERISPYIGGELGILAGSTKEYSDNNENDDYEDVKTPYLGFAINLFTGVDVYLCKGLYLGAEFGLGYGFLNNRRSSREIREDNTITKDEFGNSTKRNEFGFHATPALRLGWHF